MGILLSKLNNGMSNYMICNKMNDFLHFSACGIRNNFFCIMFAFERLCGCRKFPNNSKKSDENNIFEPIMLSPRLSPIKRISENEPLVAPTPVQMSPAESVELNNNLYEQHSESENNRCDHVIVEIEQLSEPLLNRIIVLNNLKILSNLVDGQKPWLSGNKLEVDSSYSSWVPGVRWVYAQSRVTIIPCVKDTILSAIIFKKQLDAEITNLLLSSIDGLEKLKITYPTEHNDINELITMINKN